MRSHASWLKLSEFFLRSIRRQRFTTPMSSLLHGRFKQYFQMPIDERVEGLSPAGYRYYGFLCREMNARSAFNLSTVTPKSPSALVSKIPRQLKKHERNYKLPD